MVNNPVNIPALVQQANPGVVSAIRQASQQTGVDFSYLLQNAAAESSLNQAAQNTSSSARGLYQFIETTWLDTVARHGAAHGLGHAAAAITRDSHGKPVVNDPGLRQQILALRDDPAIAALMAAEFTKDNRATLEASLGRKVDNHELYLAHFMGATGAGKLLSKGETAPSMAASQLLPAAASANHAVFYDAGRALSVAEVREQLARHFEGGLQGRTLALQQVVLEMQQPTLASLDDVDLAIRSGMAVSTDTALPVMMSATKPSTGKALALFKSLGIAVTAPTVVPGNNWKA